MNYGFETRCIHGNGTDEKTHSYGSVAVPIYQAADICPSWYWTVYRI